jgi:hypothetical protein
MEPSRDDDGRRRTEQHGDGARQSRPDLQNRPLRRLGRSLVG